MPRLGRARPHRPVFGRAVYAAPAGSTYTLTAPGTNSGAAGVASGNFTVTPNGTITATITPSDGGAGGTFTPSSLTFTASSAAQTFTYTPGSVSSTPGATAVRTISVTNNGGLTDPGSVTYTAKALVSVFFLGDSFTGDSSGGAGTDISHSYWAQQMLTHLRDDWFYTPGFAAIPGTKIEDFESYSPDPDTFYNGSAPMSLCIILGGANNFNAGDSAATTYGKLQTCCANRRATGFKVLVCSLFSGDIPGLGTGGYDVLRNAFNVLVRTNWRSFADGFIDFAANAFMGKDGSWSTNPVYYFNNGADPLHPSNTGKVEHGLHAVGPISDVVFTGGSSGGGSGGASVVRGGIVG